MKSFFLLLIALPLGAQQQPEPGRPQQGAAAESQSAQQAAAKTETPASSPEQWLTGDIDFGCRWVGDVGGDFNTYRSVVNLGQGPKLFGLNAAVRDSSHRLFDRLDVSATNWGGEPYSTARVNARRARLYEFLFDYRKIDFFNFLPSFANPAIQRGLFLSQRSFDTFRRTIDAEVNLFPGRRIVPFFAYSRNSGDGSGITNFVLQANEYPVAARFEDHTDNFRGGVRLQFERFHVTLEQGGLNISAAEQTLNNQPRNPGNLTAPFLGHNLFLAEGTESWSVEGKSIFSRGAFTASPASWADLYGQFLFSQPRTETRFRQNNTGNFFDFTTRQFYSSQIGERTSLARQPHTSASFSAELRPHGRIRVIESWMTDRLHDAGSALLTDRLLISPNNPLDPRSLSELTRLAMNYNQQQAELMVSVSRVLTLRGGHRFVWGDANAPAALILAPASSERAELRRHVALAGANLRFGQQFNLHADFEASPGDRSYFRTSLDEYRRGSLRARYQALPSLLLAANFNVLSNQNPRPDINFDYLMRQNTVTANWTPGTGKWVSLLGEYTRFTLRSELSFREPSTLDRELSLYRENGHAATALLSLSLPAAGKIQPKLGVGGSLFHTGGSRPSRYYRPLGRISVPFGNRVQWYGEWHWYSLTQPLYLFEGFRNHQFLTGFRLTM